MRNQVPGSTDPILTNVDALNFNYGIDTTDPPDGIVDSWTSAPGGTSRIIAVQVVLTASPTQVNPDINVVTPRTLQSTVT